MLTDTPAQPVGSVVLLHGFTRAPRHLDALAADCVGLGAQVLRPALGSLWWPSSSNNARHLDTVVADIELLRAPGPLVLVGHSAGAAAATWMAGGLRRSGAPVARLVLVDGVESPTHLIERAWPGIADLPVRAICAPPSRGNRSGRLAQWLGQHSGDVEVTVLPGMGHGDIESEPAAIYRWAVGDSPARPRARQLRAWIVAQVAIGLGVTPPDQ